MRFREHYTELVEHYFRMAVRHKEVKQSSDFDWFLFTSFWIDSLSNEDKQFMLLKIIIVLVMKPGVIPLFISRLLRLIDLQETPQRRERWER